MTSRPRAKRSLRGLPVALVPAVLLTVAPAPARAGTLCETAEMLVAIEIGAQELEHATPDKAAGVIGRISSSLEFTDWTAGLAGLSSAGRRTATEAIEAFVATRRAMVQAYQEGGLGAAQSAMASPDYMPYGRIIDLVEELADCSPPITVDGVREGKAQYMLHGTLPPAASPTSAGEPSMKMFWVNVLIVILALLIGRKVDAYITRRNGTLTISYETALRDGPAQLQVTLVSISRLHGRMVVPEELEPGTEVALCLGGAWYAGTVGFSTHAFAMVTFAPSLPGRVVRRTRLLGATPAPVTA